MGDLLAAEAELFREMHDLGLAVADDSLQFLEVTFGGSGELVAPA